VGMLPIPIIMGIPIMDMRSLIIAVIRHSFEIGRHFRFRAEPKALRAVESAPSSTRSSLLASSRQAR
jgi:hypothetical protein